MKNIPALHLELIDGPYAVALTTVNARWSAANDACLV